jgi:aldose 1-epimerase
VVIIATTIQLIKKGNIAMNIEKGSFGQTKDGKAVQLYTLTNDSGVIAKVTNYGGIITELWVPDRDGKLADVVLGFDNNTDYPLRKPYRGGKVNTGRCNL